MNRLEKIFASRQPVLIMCDCCGAPDMQESLQRLNVLLDNGTDILDLYIPFSDPMADDAALRQASQLALANGATLEKILDLLPVLRQQHPDCGLIISGYYNVFLQYKPDKLFAQLAAAGIDGIHIIDLPWEERSEVQIFCDQYNIPRLEMIAESTSAERSEQILRTAQGMVFFTQPEQLNQLRKLTRLPLVLKNHPVSCGADALEVTNAAAYKLNELPELVSSTVRMIV